MSTEKAIIDDTTVDGAPAEKTHATTEVPGAEAHAKPKALGLDATMWVAVAMLVVIGLAIWKKVPAMIGAALDGQIAAIKAQLDQATNLRKEAEAIKSEYEARAKQAAAEAIVSKAKADATALIARRTQSAEDKIAAAERAAVADVRASAAQAAAAAAAALIAVHHDAKTDANLVNETIAKLN
jgi:F-type H+-transporting ATPase subunit b